MNEATKKFFVKIYFEEEISGSDFVDWAIACLEDGFDSKSLRLLAGMDKTHSIRADFEELFRRSLQELDLKYLDKKEFLLNYAKEVARQIISNEIESVEAVEKIYKVYVRLNYLVELEMWGLLYDGHSYEWFDKSWIPFVQKFNYEKWHEVVNREAKDLIKTDFA